MTTTARTPRIVNAQRMGAKLHWCVEDARGVQKCACGAEVVQSMEIRVGRAKDGLAADWREYDLEPRDFCRRGCWAAYLAYLKEQGWSLPTND